jgi:phosphotransferase system enzyme I (PtsI)
MVLGFATDLGSPTAHTAVMARAMNIPAVVGLHDISVRVSTGDEILMDGNKGLLILHPTEQRLKEYGHVIEVRESIRSGLSGLRDLPAQTIDGHRVILSANMETSEEVDSIAAYGAEGVGLFRSEFLFLAKAQLPDEAAQAAIYDEVAGRLAPAKVVIRTLDLGGDKFLSHERYPDEMNPFMGWRAIRLCLAQPAMFSTQMRAILRASRHGNVRIMYPMVSKAEEVEQANELLARAKDQLRGEGVPFDENIEVGVMIETPSAALTVDVIADHVRFFSIGTNDLIQYTLAVDRVNERVAYLYEPTHPAIIRLIRQTVEVGHARGLSVSLCGEMGASPILAPLLVGMGVDTLSVAPPAVPVVKQAIRSIEFADAQRLAQEAYVAKSAGEIVSRCRDLIARKRPEILELVS